MYKLPRFPIHIFLAFNCLCVAGRGDEAILAPASQAGVPAEVPRKFVVDKFGQSVRKEYQGKVTSEQELKDDVAKDKAYFDSLQEAPRDAYGGLPGSGEKYQLRKTGFFRLDKVNNRDILVDPEGNIFYHLGVCSMATYQTQTVVRGREKIFEWLPPKDGDYADVWLPADRTGVTSYYLANWVRKYGIPFDVEEWTGMQIHRLRKWGFNSGGIGSLQNKTMMSEHFAYTPGLPLGVKGGQRLTNMKGVTRMYDPFAPGTEETMDKAYAENIAPNAGNPNILGYYIENEVKYENVPKLVPAQKSDSPSKLRLVQLLSEKYQGDINTFNAAWAAKAPFKSFDELKDGTLFVTTEAAVADMKAFMELFLEAHYAMVARIFRKYDSNHLLLGSRWQPGTSNNEMLVRIASKYTDIISVNYYTSAIEEAFLKRIHDWSGGKPMLMSEWNYCSNDQGLVGSGDSQKTRGLAYRNYVETTAALPFVIGEQWFTYPDQPFTGRWFEGFNGEGGNTGLINVADRPYFDFVNECKKTNDDIYKIVLGERPPFHFNDPRFSPRQAGIQKTVSVPRALAGLKLDATSENWGGLHPSLIDAGNLVVGTSVQDFSTRFRLCWDDECLYVLADVKDKTPLINVREGAALWNGDCIELFVGGKKIKEPGEPLLSDRHILLGASDQPKFFVINTSPQPGGIKVIAVKNPTGDGYTLEAALPWAALGFKPEPDKEFLFDIGVDNADGGPARGGPARGNQWMWSGGMRNSSERSSWGIAKLVTN